MQRLVARNKELLFFKCQVECLTAEVGHLKSQVEEQAQQLRAYRHQDEASTSRTAARTPEASDSHRAQRQARREQGRAHGASNWKDEGRMPQEELPTVEADLDGEWGYDGALVEEGGGDSCNHSKEIRLGWAVEGERCLQEEEGGGRRGETRHSSWRARQTIALAKLLLFLL